MIATILLIIGTGIIAFGTYMLHLANQKPAKYVWVGSGKDPFKN
jgi:hypothetical protein